MKKFLAIVLALTTVLGLCACGSGNNSAGGQTEDGKTILSIGIAPNALVMDLDNNELTKWVEEQCNVELKFVEYAGGTDVATQISTQIGANQVLPDILYGFNLGEDVIAKYGEEEYFVDLTPYFEDREGASKVFWDRITTELTEYEQDVVDRKIHDADTGAIYAVPIIETSTTDKMDFQMWINQKWLDELNLEIPTSTEEFYNVLKAFQKAKLAGDRTIPLYGSTRANLGGNIMNFLMNLFVYYDADRPFIDNGDGKLQAVYTTNEYREGLKFFKKLLDENLLPITVFTDTNTSMKQVITPREGQAWCGVVAAHLTLHTITDSEVMYDYVPMQTWGNAVKTDLTVNPNTFITMDCYDGGRADKAFEVLMKLFTYEGSLRVRYGAEGINWVAPDEGAKSAQGLDAQYKLLIDALSVQNTSCWGTIASTFNRYAEGEEAQSDPNASKYFATRLEMHAESYRLFQEAAEKNNPKNIVPPLVYTTEEKEDSLMIRTNINDYWKKAQTDFLNGVDGMDINSDKSWNEYLKKLDDMGLQTYLELAQKAYDRQ